MLLRLDMCSGFHRPLAASSRRRRGWAQLLATLSFCAVAFGLFSADGAHAQFRNGSFHIGGGWTGLGTSTDWALSAIGNEWVATDQAAISVRGGYAVPAFNEFTPFDDVLTVYLGGDVGMGTVPLTTTVDFPLVFSVAAVMAGMKYSFLDEKHRPYINTSLSTLFIPFAEAYGIPVSAVQNQALWLGVRAGGGYEWFFYEEMSLSAEANAVAYVTIGNFKFSPEARVFYGVYF